MVLLLAVLGLGMCCAPAVAAQPVAPAPVAERTVAAVAAPGHDKPGCGPGERRDGLDEPAQTPRPSTAQELLPALAEAHGGGGSCGGDQAVLDLTPVRMSPELVALSPVDLSVLRV
ncbi:putative protein OS=Streptomyces alboniger OX=132473 GN=CP975_16785 PE=4 SV=1 [Streptomyces alboniger]